MEQQLDASLNAPLKKKKKTHTIFRLRRKQVLNKVHNKQCFGLKNEGNFIYPPLGGGGGGRGRFRARLPPRPPLPNGGGGGPRRGLISS